MLAISGAAAILLVGATTASIYWRGLPTLPRWYFFEQDLPLLVAAALALLLASRISWAAAGRGWPSERRFIALCVVASGLAYIGTWLVIERYGVSRDEILADFAATTFQNGRLGWPVPPGYHAIAEALMPLWSDRALSEGYWVSNYLPVNALIRAGAGLIGDQWLAGPLLLLIGFAALWVSARRIWPDRVEAPGVAVLMALSSTQLLVNAMTPYATTGHFALNALWLACFLRGGRAGHAAAIAIGFAATGLHQFHFHLMMVMGFVAWLALNRRYRLAALYVLACAGYYFAWDIVWWKIALGDATAAAREMPAPAVQFGRQLLNKIALLGNLELLNSLARFAAWNNVLLLPLGILGWLDVRSRRDTAGGYPVQVAFALVCVIGLMAMVYQGHGYGYRYLNGMIPFFCLLAAHGWLSLVKGRAPAGLLWASAGFAMCVTLPFAAYRVNGFVHPYAAAYRAMRSAPADVVLVDTRAGAFAQDLVRIEGAVSRPLLLDLAFVKPETLERLCRTQRVALFNRRQAAALGIREERDFRSTAARTAEMRAIVERLGCTTPVPIG